MPIEASSPIVADQFKMVPQVETKTFNAFWITRVMITSTPGETNVRATLVPWNTETNEILPSQPRDLNLPEIETMIAAGDTQLGGVFTSVIAEIERQARAKGVI